MDIAKIKQGQPESIKILGMFLHARGITHDSDGNEITTHGVYYVTPVLSGYIVSKLPYHSFN